MANYYRCTRGVIVADSFSPLTYVQRGVACQAARLFTCTSSSIKPRSRFHQNTHRMYLTDTLSCEHPQTSTAVCHTQLTSPNCRFTQTEAGRRADRYFAVGPTYRISFPTSTASCFPWHGPSDRLYQHSQPIIREPNSKSDSIDPSGAAVVTSWPSKIWRPLEGHRNFKFVFDFCLCDSSPTHHGRPAAGQGS